MKLTKSRLAIEISKLDTFYSQKVRVEQYSTDSEVAATMLWLAQEMGDITDKNILDMGAGTGLLGLGTMFFNPKCVTFVDVDQDALDILEKNKEKVSQLIDITKNKVICSDIKDYSSPADTIITNPPFGTKTRHADRDFLKKAFKLSSTIYSLQMVTIYHTSME